MELQGSSVAVTGATGFLGRYICDTLLGRRARVIGVVRNPGRVPELRARGVELRRADLAEPDRLAEGFAGADAVVSNAALLPLRSWRWREHEATNVRGTRNVFDAIVRAGVRRVVHLSSVAVYRGGGPVPIAEDHPLRAGTAGSPLTAYAVSKALSEQHAWAAAREHDLALTTLRPSAIFGAFDTTFKPVFARLASLPLTVMPAFTHLSFVYAGDVAEAVALALERPVAVGRAYNVTGDTLSMWEFLRAWRAAGGRATRWTIPVPVPVRQAYDRSRAANELGWRTRPVIDGLRETFALEGATT